MSVLPLELKHLETIEARAKELEDVEPAVSYWCRYWIVQKSIEKKERSAAVEQYLMSVLEQLETMKIKHARMEEIEKMNLGKSKVESFALQVFDNADREERAKRATKATSVKFLAAATFLEVCQVFGPPAKDLVDKRKYAKVQAMRIQSAIVAGKDPNEGKLKGAGARDAPPTVAESAELDALLRTPVVPSLEEASSGRRSPKGHPDISQPFSLSPIENSSDTDLTSRQESMLPSPRESRPGYFERTKSEDQMPAPAVLVAKAPDAMSLTTDSRPAQPTYTADIDADCITSAQKHAKFAISALNYDDIATAISELHKALKDLGDRHTKTEG